MPDFVSTPLNETPPNPKPGLFNIKHSKRDFQKKASWSKNKFNSSFPTALALYMENQGLPLVYLKLGSDLRTVEKSAITTSELFGLNLSNKEAYLDYEAPYSPYAGFVTSGQTPKVDLKVLDHETQDVLSGFEIKLTVVPDDATHALDEQYWGSELVIRMPSLIFLACSIAKTYQHDLPRLMRFFGRSGSFGAFNNYREPAQVNTILPKIGEIIHAIIADNIDNQRPTLIQPIWKTMGKRAKLAENCLDVFVWSDLAFTRLFLANAYTTPATITKDIDRPTRAVIQLFFMLHEYAQHGKFNPHAIQNALSYKTKNDKAFSVSGRVTNPIMDCAELRTPRVRRDQIKEIILNGGEEFLSPERRFDAVLVSSIGLFEEQEKKKRTE
ncbi:HindVP family restriction endonuclease [Hymenobacter sp. UYCo722]|uniref:HindVP family restriction endonuclease n=1 Tax=Hymenobacter sp. UYCo722 TaxID=3156335 RepID=UPI0033920FD0